MEGRRTVRVVVDVAPEDKTVLHETIEQFLWAANAVIDAGWADDEAIETSRTTLHDRTYEPVREATALHSHLVQAARNRAAAALTSTVERRQNGQATGKPTFTSPTVRYTTKSATIATDHATLATVTGRVRVDFRRPTTPDGTPYEYLDADETTVTGPDLVYDDVRNRFELHIRVHTAEATETASEDEDGCEATEPADTEHRTVLGVDLGIDHLAVTSTGRFWNGSELTHWRAVFEQRRSSLQACGTRWAYEAIRRIGRRESGYYDDVFHRISKELVAEARSHGCTAIAIEDLSGIRDRFPGDTRFQTWAFDQLTTYLQYKADAAGITVYQVNPAQTSRRCSRCGHVASGNRTSQSQFDCKRCGYSVNADYNAAKNIGLRALRSAQMSSTGGAPVGVRLNSGVLTPAGAHVPLRDSHAEDAHSVGRR